MSDAFREVLSKTAKTVWKSSRKESSGFRESIEVPPGKYRGVLDVSTKKTAGGNGKDPLIIVSFKATVNEGDYTGKQAEESVFINPKDPSRGLTSLAINLKSLFPEKATAIEEADLESIADMIDSLEAKQYVLSFDVTKSEGKGKNKGKTFINVRFGATQGEYGADEEDEDEDNVEEEENTDEEEDDEDDED